MMKNVKCVGLALGGGVARGLVHLGVLRVLEEAGIRIDRVAGASAGALIGAIYCARPGLAQVEALAGQLSWWRFVRPTWPVRGFFSLTRLETWLREVLGDPDFADLPRPLAVVAADLESERPVVLHTGKVAPAVRASCSVPGLFTPVALQGRWLGDGCVVNSVPVSALREMGADYVIGVDCFRSALRQRWGPFGFGFAALEILVRHSGGGLDSADCLISPDLAGSSYVRLSQRADFIQWGEVAARAALPQIKATLGLE